MVTVHNLIGDLFTPVRRKTVKDSHILLRTGQQSVINLIFPESFLLFPGMRLLTHAYPNIGIYDISQPCGLLGVAQYNDLASGRRCSFLKYGGIRFETFRAVHPKIKSHQGCSLDHVITDIVPVAYKSDLKAPQSSLPFDYCHHVRQYLAGVMKVAQPIDYRYGRVRGKLFERRMS